MEFPSGRLPGVLVLAATVYVNISPCLHADTDERIDCQVFVSILTYSGLIFCQAVGSQKTQTVICKVYSRQGVDNYFTRQTVIINTCIALPNEVQCNNFK